MKGEKERRRKKGKQGREGKRKENKMSHSGVQTATFHSTGTAYHVKVESHIP